MKKEYNAPRFECEELVLSEAVANTCWSTNGFWYDFDGDGDFSDEKFISMEDIGFNSTGGCTTGWIMQATKYVNNSTDFTVDQKNKFGKEINIASSTTQSDNLLLPNS